MIKTVRLKSHRDKRVQAGHLWIFSNELEDGFQNCSPGEVVEIRNAKNHFMGMGMVNPRSLIAVRVLSKVQCEIDKLFFQEKIRQAISLRNSLLKSNAESCRLIYSEADGLPGLIVDRIADCLVMQTLTSGMDSFLELIAEVLSQELNPSAIIIANDSQSRLLEGLPLKRELLKGNPKLPLEFVQDNIHFIADPLSSQKTGFFFDQRFNRAMLHSFVKPEAKVLDLFCFTGSFGLYALKAGAAQVTFVDDSQSALSFTEIAAAKNGWSNKSRFIKTDIFPWLKSYDEKFDVVILDPPALAKSRTKVPSALRAYRDLNARAVKLVNSGGILATASCSGLVTRAAWRETLAEASAKSGKNLRIIAEGCQAPDHPILSAMPETEYLKFVVATVD